MIEKDSRPIASLREWEKHAGPKSPSQWRDGRSAKECARAWLESGTGAVPSEVEAAVVSHMDFGPFASWHAEPEARVPFDSFKGEPPNIDVLVELEDERGRCLLAIEAKADEPFGDTVAGTMAKARARATSNPRSRGVERVEQLADAILGVRPEELDSISDVRYQLLTACAACQAEAGRRGADRAVVLVHEFLTQSTDDSKHTANAEALSEFVHRLTGTNASEVSPGSMVGPIQLRRSRLIPEPVPLYVGKAVRNLR